MKLTCY